MKRISLFVFLAWCLRAQDGTPVITGEGSPPTGYQFILNYTGANLTSLCIARSAIQTGQRLAVHVAISAVSKANPAVVTSTAHGFNVNSRPAVTISGATGTGWTGINGNFVATVIDANTFSIPVDSTGFGTLAGTVTFVTTAPRTGVPEWAVKKLVYDGSNNLIWIGWLNGSSAYQAKCSDATSTTVSQQ